MITILNLYKNTDRFTDPQIGVLIDCITRYSNTPNGEWLKSIDYSHYDYLWGKDLVDTFVMAAIPSFGKSIVAQPSGDCPDYWVRLVAPSIIHELRHVWQRKKYGLLVYSCCSLISRIFLLFSEKLYSSTLLEKDAFYHEDKAADCILQGGV